LDWNNFSDESTDQFIQILNDSKLIFLSLLGNNYSQKGINDIVEQSRADIKTFKKTEYYQYRLRTESDYKFMYEFF